VELPHRGREAALRAVVERFALRLEHHVRLAPLNWFNFFDFWA
jgi:predicted LPLAT superfamily acyltransferase